MWVDFFLAGVPPCTCTYDIWQSMGCIRHIMGEDFGHIGAIHQNLLFCFFFPMENVVPIPNMSHLFSAICRGPMSLHLYYNARRDPLCVLLVSERKPSVGSMFQGCSLNL